MNTTKNDDFRCFIVRQLPNGSYASGIERCPAAELPDGDVLIRVAYSSLNYKDALSALGHPGVTKKFPHIPGIDAAGTVIDSRSEKFRTGDEVIVTGFDFGASRWGGYAELTRVPADWVVPLPAGLTLKESMIYGTAGFTAGMSLEVIEHRGIDPVAGPVLVTGASGGVGSDRAVGNFWPARDSRCMRQPASNRRTSFCAGSAPPDFFRAKKQSITLGYSAAESPLGRGD